MMSPAGRSSDHELLLRETNHRCANDLQLVVSLLALQSRRAVHPETRAALRDTMERVAVLARARKTLHGETMLTLEGAMRQVCDALHAHSQPRAIDIIFEPGDGGDGLSPGRITTLALVVNELATNAIKHAFEETKGGTIRVAIGRNGSRDVTVTVDDDGLPFPELQGNGAGLGLGLVKRMMASIDGLLIPPPTGTKLFELRVPLALS